MALKKRESKKQKAARVVEILDLLRQKYPVTNVGLQYTTTLELLIAVILSAQCTDERVDMVTRELFKKYRSAEDFVRVPREELEMDIRPTGFYRNKAKNIQECCRRIVEVYNGEVPDNIEDLTTLAGVGRKTANVILSHIFKKQAVVVDTHVTRLTNRLGFVETDDAVKIEYAMMEITPEPRWVELTHLLITHGRAICKARMPLCEKCIVNTLCPSAFIIKQNLKQANN
ncbi:MAG TPA: endonuclease III [Patescibacteria group bacterium]|nr:endonuclease III [Patescibacteria group bacterium]